MGTVVWQGKVTSVTQIASATVDSVDGTPSNNDFHLTVGGITLTVAGNTDANTTASNLVTLAEASTHPYFTGVTWAAPGGGIILATAKTAGVPFAASLTVTGAGTGSVTDFSDSQACTGPHDWGNDDNWDTGTKPANSDDVIIPPGTPEITMGIAQSGVTLASLTHLAGAPKVGLRSYAFATSADGETVETEYPEYRQHYLDIGADVIDIGEHAGPGSPTHSSRIKIDNAKSGASLLTVHGSATTGEGNRPPILYIAAHASGDVEVRDGVVGIAADSAGETATVGDINVVSLRNTTRVFTGQGVTMTNWRQRSGLNRLDAAATVTLAEVNGGELDVVGDGYAVTTMTVTAGTVRDKHTHSSAVTGTLNANGGQIDLSLTDVARTVTTLNVGNGRVKADWSKLTVTNFTAPSAGIREVVGAEV